MDKKLLILTVTMVLSMLGIIYLQTSWIRQAYEAELHHINRLADEALAKSVERLNLEHNVEMTGETLPEIAGPTADRESGTIRDSLYYYADSMRIHQYFEEYLRVYGLDDMTRYIQLVFLGQKTQNPASGFYVENKSALPLGTGLKKYRVSTPTTYHRWVAAYFHSHAAQITPRMTSGIFLSVTLILILSVSFTYLIWLLRRQKRIAQMKDDFITNLTHEFKTPISTVAAALEALQDFNALKDPEKTTRYLAVSRQEIARLDNMVTYVLHIASYENNSLKITKEEVNLGVLIRQVTEAEKIRANKTIEFPVDIDTRLGAIHLDKHHFTSVLVNLIDNAIKYSGDNVRIAIKAVLENDMVHLSISDNGIGIPASELRHVFDKFFRVRQDDTYAKGTGVGLSYVKAIVELHNGTITVESILKVGTTFHIYIPLA